MRWYTAILTLVPQRSRCCSEQEPSAEARRGATFAKQMGVTRTKKGKNRPLAEVISEFEHKVVVAAQKFQQQLASNPALRTQCAGSSSVEEPPPRPPVPDSAEQCASEDPFMEVADDSVLAKLMRRQRKRMAASETEEQRPAAKSKATGREQANSMRCFEQ